jgi:hypothetical protein
MARPTLKLQKRPKRVGIAVRKNTRTGKISRMQVDAARKQKLPTEPTAEEIAEGRAVARELFDPAAAAAARSAFLERQRPNNHA